MKLKDFFYFNRSDRTVLLFFLLLAIVAFSLVFFVGGEGEYTIVGVEDTLGVRNPSVPPHREHFRRPYYRVESRPAERFAFDPNTADSTTLLRLGLQQWQVRNIYKYRAAGGIYRRPSDFARLYGLTQKQYRELEPYIRISKDYAPASELFVAAQPERHDTAHRYTVKLKPEERLDLNVSDTSRLKRVPGIGSYFARKIVEYRQRLGGFYSAGQLREIEGFPESAVSFFEVGGGICKINLNTLRLNELKRHPYLNYYQAKAVIDYRRLRGPLKSLDDLRLLKDFSETDIERLRHYVEF